MSSVVDLIHLLADGKVHSGSELAAHLGVSRTAIWKQVDRLAEYGLSVKTIPRVGYQLERELELLCLDSINDNLITSFRSSLSINIYQSISSTNSLLMEASAQDGVRVAIAEHQTAGRGRRGRAWVSPYGTNLYFSLRRESSAGLAAFEGLSLAVGVVVAETLTSLGIDGVALKWPNDVLLYGKKLGGVLIEVAGDPSGQCSLVLGVGINLGATQEMQAQIDQPWVDLQSGSSPEIGRNFLAGRLIGALATLLLEYEENGFKTYRTRWQSLNAYQGLTVTATIGVQVLEGTVSGIDDQGALILQTDRGEQRLHGGEISLRVQHDS